METNAVHDEYLGDIFVEQVLQHLTNINPHCNSIADVRRDSFCAQIRPAKFLVSAEYEFTWDGDPKTTLPISKRFVGLSLTPEGAEIEYTTVPLQ